jgi:hypothetical protein
MRTSGNSPGAFFFARYLKALNSWAHPFFFFEPRPNLLQM